MSRFGCATYGCREWAEFALHDPAGAMVPAGRYCAAHAITLIRQLKKDGGSWQLRTIVEEKPNAT